MNKTAVSLRWVENSPEMTGMVVLLTITITNSFEHTHDRFYVTALNKPKL